MKIKLLTLLLLLLPLFLSGCKDESTVKGDAQLEKFYNEKLKEELEEKQKIKQAALDKIANEERIKQDALDKIKAAEIEAERIANLDPYKNYTELKITSDNMQLQKMIDDSIMEYEIIIDDLRIKFKANIVKLNSPRETNIKELDELLNIAKEEYNVKCKKIKESNIQECKGLGIDKIDLELKISSLNNSITETMEKSNKEEIKQLDKYNKLMQKNINHLLNQE
jgi:hypothetical protein